MDSKEYGYGKVFNTRDLIGEQIIVTTRDHNLEVRGVLAEFFERTQAIMLKRYEILVRKEGDSMAVVEKGDFIFMKQDSWLSMRAKTVMNRKLLA